jgi:glyoxylate reductase
MARRTSAVDRGAGEPTMTAPEVGGDAPVLVTRRLPAPGVAPLRAAGLEVDVRDVDAPMPRPELLAAVAGRRALLCTLGERIDDEVLSAAGDSLAVVANYAVGYDNVDIAACARRGVVVTNTPDVLTEATADLAWALILAAARRVVEGDQLVRSGAWSGWAPSQLLGASVHGRTLGIVGLGRIGAATARRARGFEMPVVYHNRRPVPELERELGARWVTLDELLAEADVVSLHAPLTPGSTHLIDADRLARMRPGAVLVNTARGPLIDEAALVEALRAGRPGAAGLDVYEREPAIAGGLAELDNVVLLPHLGSGTADARGAMVELCCANIVAVLAGGPPRTPVTG